MSSRINHVSVDARDLRESVDFYVELVGAEPIPSPNFGVRKDAEVGVLRDDGGVVLQRRCSDPGVMAAKLASRS